MSSGQRKKQILVPESVNKPSGLKNDGTPNAHWRRFEERLKNHASVPLSEWGPEEVLGYLLHRYQSHFGLDWALSYSKPPSKSAEMYIVTRMMTTVGTQKAWIMKQYIDWVFDKEIIPKKKEITSLAYFFHKGLCNQFRATFQKQTKITRTSELPSEYIAIVNSLGLSLATYGDLAFVKMALDAQPGLQPYTNLFTQLNDLGFDSNILSTLE